MIAIVTRLWTVGDPAHETARRYFGKACHIIGTTLYHLVWILIGVLLTLLLGVPYLTRSIEESCQRVSGPEVEAVLLRHGAQRTETLADHVERSTPLVAQGIVEAEDLAKEEGWLVCPILMPTRAGR